MVKRDIGELGPAETTLYYHWKWYYSALSAILWLLTFLIIIGVRSNRSAQAWLIFIPVLIIYLVWTIFKKIVGADSIQLQFLDIIIDGLIFSQAIMWLLADNFSTRNRLVNFLISLAVMMIAGIAAIFSFVSFELSLEIIVTVIVLGVLLLAIIGGQGLAVLMCRKKYGAVKFSLMTALWQTVIVTIPMAIYCVFILFVLINTSGFLRSAAVFAGVAIATAILAAIVYGVTLPFLILVQKNSFWKKRFFAWARLPQPAKVTPDAAEITENTQIS